MRPYLTNVYQKSKSFRVRHIILHHRTKVRDEKNELVDLDYNNRCPVEHMLDLHKCGDHFRDAHKLSLLTDTDLALTSFCNFPLWVDTLILKAVTVNNNIYLFESLVADPVSVNIPYCCVTMTKDYLQAILLVVDKLINPLTVAEEDAVIHALSNSSPSAVNGILKPFLSKYGNPVIGMAACTVNLRPCVCRCAEESNVESQCTGPSWLRSRERVDDAVRGRILPNLHVM